MGGEVECVFVVWVGVGWTREDADGAYGYSCGCGVVGPDGHREGKGEK